MFLAAFFAFGLGEKIPIDRKASFIALAGMFAGLIYALVLIGLFSNME